MEGNIDLEDAIQEGSIGLIKGIKKIDFSKHDSPASYFSFWIIQHINRAIKNRERIIRLPVHVHNKLKKIKDEETKYYNKYNCTPKTKEISKATGIEEEELENIKKYFEELVSLEYLIQQETEGSINSQFYNFDKSPLDIVFEQLLKKDIYKILNLLNPREKEVILYRMGFIDNNPKTLEEIGKIFNVTRERIRQIESKAIRKLRHPSRSKFLKDYYSQL